MHYGEGVQCSHTEQFVSFDELNTQTGLLNASGIATFVVFLRVERKVHQEEDKNQKQ